MRHQSSGTFELPLPAAEAIWLFTPEGERVWAPGWDPVYAAGDPSEAPGTVFTTAAHGVETIWVIIEISRSGHFAAYARLTPGRHAGTVRVHCIDARPGASTIAVAYDMSLLGDRQAGAFDAYAPARFDDMLHEWSRAIVAYLDRTG